MTFHRKTFQTPSATLEDALQDELSQLVNSARRTNRVEAVMRLRALAEIGALLDTDQLIALTLEVAAGTRPAATADRAA